MEVMLRRAQHDKFLYPVILSKGLKKEEESVSRNPFSGPRRQSPGGPHHFDDRNLFGVRYRGSG